MDLWTFFEVHGPEVAARRLVRLVLVCRRSVLLHCLNHTLMWLTGSSCSDCEVAAMMLLYGQTVCSAGGGGAGWNAAVDLSRASSLFAGRAELWLTAILKGP